MFVKPAYKLLVTGSTGLVGSKFLQDFKNKFSIITIGRSNVDLKINLTSKREVLKTVISSDADAIINFAAFTNVDEAEKEKGDKLGEVYTLNAMLPLWLAQACEVSGKSLYHISTDYVFDGKQNLRPYTEEDSPSPVNSWYSISKYQGELNVRNVFKEENLFTIVRISYPYSGIYNRKLDFTRAIIDKLKKGETYFAITNQKIKPTSVDDIAQALSSLINKQIYGVYHIAGKYKLGYISPYEFAQKVAEIMEMDATLIKPISFLEFSKKRIAPRPQHTWLNTKKIENLGFNITNNEDALKRFKQQLLGVS